MKKISLFVLLIIISPMIVFASTKAPIDVTTMSISDISSALDEGIITSEQLVNIYLDRISAYDNVYNAINQINSKAIEIAGELDKERTSSKVRSILHGIPILVKTNIDVENLATTAGAKALQDNYPNENAEIIQKLIDAGAIIIGSTNMSEFAFSAQNSYSSYGSVKNAWNSLYTPYGSSGGSAVAIALSFAAAAIGTDTNSSIRVPASANYVVGLRPSLGLVSTKGIIPYDVTRDTAGPITKTVEDAAIILSIIASDDVDTSNYINSSTTTNLEGITIGVPTNILEGTGTIEPLSSTYSEIYNMMLTAISNYQKLGAEIIYLDNFYSTKYYDIYNNTLAGKTFCYGFNNYINNTTGTIRSFSDLVKSSGKVYNLSGYESLCATTTTSSLAKIETKRDVFRSYLNNYYSTMDIDVILYPTTKNKLSTTGTNLRSVSKYFSSVTGYPSITIPLGFDTDGLPYGMELLGLFNSESTLLSIAGAYDNAYIESIIPKEVPNLYTIDDKAKYIVQNYLLINNNNKYKDLVNQTKEYFKNYSLNSNADSLYQKYLTLGEEEKIVEGINKNTVFDKFMVDIFYILIVIVILKYGRKELRKKRKYSK